MRFPITRRPSGIVAFFFVCVLAVQAVAQEDPRLLSLSGQTMGTTYMVKIYDPPEFDPPVQLQVDAELRRVNDEMSTYLRSSEISRFNTSSSTDWFPVSRSFAEVVDFALHVSRQSDGAFDVTVSPLVDAWNFGAGSESRSTGKRPTKIPDQEELQKLATMIGYEKLDVRLDPPAIRKSEPELQIDLSALAKGHGTDRVVELLNGLGAKHVFVEIGGEVRTSGDKAGQWWRVGIQLPDAVGEMVMLAHSMSSVGSGNQAMATSGDYRNFYEVDGVRYSHTIDPRTLRPISHALASVSVVADTCMAADAWATAINVLGPEEGLALAEREQLNALLIHRSDSSYLRSGTGILAQYGDASAAAASATKATEKIDREAAGEGSFVPVLLLTVVLVAGILIAMAIGVIFGRRSISGSCGGLAGARNEDGSVSCSLCSNPDDACRELRQRMTRQASPSDSATPGSPH